jgi:hypothetical protein
LGQINKIGAAQGQQLDFVQGNGCVYSRYLIQYPDIAKPVTRLMVGNDHFPAICRGTVDAYIATGYLKYMIRVIPTVIYHFPINTTPRFEAGADIIHRGLG